MTIAMEGNRHPEDASGGRRIPPNVRGRLLRRLKLLAMTIAPLALLFAILTAGWWIKPAQVSGLPLCFFKVLTGLDCPGCGLTRSFLALARGHLGEAIRFNAAGPLVYLLFAGYFVEGVGRLASPRFQVRLPVKAAKVYGTLVAVFLFGHWILRLKNELFTG